MTQYDITTAGAWAAAGSSVISGKLLVDGITFDDALSGEEWFGERMVRKAKTSNEPYELAFTTADFPVSIPASQHGRGANPSSILIVNSDNNEVQEGVTHTLDAAGNVELIITNAAATFNGFVRIQ